ncbi:MAG: CinA family protein [Prevotellaceae bacterium]|jgi:PncC family amidohydrolase|nr:CinA family protein [Prevotellaceae bacterium]
MTLEQEIGISLRRQGLTIATAESCTGGALAARITSVPGSSAYFTGGIVAYSNVVKQSVLHVSPQTLEQQGAVSRQTVCEMAQGVMQLLHTDCAIATSGIAGPNGGTPDKPVGTVWIAVAYKNKIVTHLQSGDCGRVENVQRTVQKALQIVSEVLKERENSN